MFQNNEAAAILVFQTKPVGFGLSSYANNFFCSHKFVELLATRVKTLYTGYDTRGAVNVEGV